MTCLRWSALPNMPQVNAYHSALCIADEESGDVALLIVGGNGGTAKEAEMLTSRPRRTRRGQGSGSNPWRWQQLSSMQIGRPNHPGMLRLGKERVLVVGSGRGRSAEILQLPRGDNDRGGWTLLRETMTQEFAKTFLANFNGHILAFGESFVKHVRQ